MIQPNKSKKNKITIKSPGKINLHLAIGEKRGDGFHELDSIFAALDFADSLTISALPENGAQTRLVTRKEGPFLELSQKGQHFPPLPTEKNMVYLASELFRSKTGIKTNLSIELINRIPPGSGLGGGSSNAAATLIALNELFCGSGGKFSGEDLLDMAANLGSDVPFFVEIALQNPATSPARLVGGRGEILRFAEPPPDLAVVLAFPGFASNTGDAYALLDKHRPTINEKKYFSSKDFSWGPPEEWKFFNDFQELFLNHGTEREKDAYQTILDGLKKAGAAFAGLSGSGSCCFGIFNEPKPAAPMQNSKVLVFHSTFFLRN